MKKQRLEVWFESHGGLKRLKLRPKLLKEHLEGGEPSAVVCGGAGIPRGRGWEMGLDPPSPSVHAQPSVLRIPGPAQRRNPSPLPPEKLPN